jgi:hypothetical protein
VTRFRHKPAKRKMSDSCKRSMLSDGLKYYVASGHRRLHPRLSRLLIPMHDLKENRTMMLAGIGKDDAWQGKTTRTEIFDLPGKMQNKSFPKKTSSLFHLNEREGINRCLF